MTSSGHVDAHTEDNPRRFPRSSKHLLIHASIHASRLDTHATFSRCFWAIGDRRVRRQWLSRASTRERKNSPWYLTARVFFSGSPSFAAFVLRSFPMTRYRGLSARITALDYAARSTYRHTCKYIRGTLLIHWHAIKADHAINYFPAANNARGLEKKSDRFRGNVRAEITKSIKLLGRSYRCALHDVRDVYGRDKKSLFTVGLRKQRLRMINFAMLDVISDRGRFTRPRSRNSKNSAWNSEIAVCFRKIVRFNSATKFSWYASQWNRTR